MTRPDPQGNACRSAIVSLEQASRLLALLSDWGHGADVEWSRGAVADALSDLRGLLARLQDKRDAA